MLISSWRDLRRPAVVVGALGYFVDVYDLVLFSVLRVASLTSLGLSDAEVTLHSIRLLKIQMGGMLLGGILWGILGDRCGRVALLFGSIFLYSVANIANGFVHTTGAYELWRFLAGVGLAGELGGCITLVSELASKEMRGYATTLVTAVGVSGAVAGATVATWVDWRTSYFIGGGMGLALLVLRLGVADSGMYRALQERPSGLTRGNFFSLFTRWDRFVKYLRCIVVGVPHWYAIGLLVTFSPEFSRQLGIVGTVESGYAILFIYSGITCGDLLSGLFSQWLRSRKKVMLGFLLLAAAAVLLYFGSGGRSAAAFYAIIGLIGVGVGYWAVFITVAAEQFGTNIRATVTTSVPNFVRGSVVPVGFAFEILRAHMNILHAAAILGVICFVLAFLSLWGMEETYGKDLDYREPA